MNGIDEHGERGLRVKLSCADTFDVCRFWGIVEVHRSLSDLTDPMGVLFVACCWPKRSETVRPALRRRRSWILPTWRCVATHDMGADGVVVGRILGAVFAATGDRGRCRAVVDIPSSKAGAKVRVIQRERCRIRRDRRRAIQIRRLRCAFNGKSRGCHQRKTVQALNVRIRAAVKAHVDQSRRCFPRLPSRAERQ